MGRMPHLLGHCPLVALAFVAGCGACRATQEDGALPSPDGAMALPSEASVKVAVEAVAIGAGPSRWVDSNLDPEFRSINARVDIGSMKQVGDEIEVTIRFPLGPGLRADEEHDHPGLVVPDGSTTLEVDRVRCGRDRLQYYFIENSLVAPDGGVLYRDVKDPAAARQHEEDAHAKEVPTLQFAKYGTSPRDLVCWAAARKCEGAPFTWPPPPNHTRFDDPQYAQKRDAHDARFVPACTLR